MTGSVRLLNLARLREHPLRTALTVVAIGAGVALFVAVLVARASLDHALDNFGEQSAGPATLKVTGPTHIAGLDESVLPKVERTPGVESAVPLVQTATIAKDTDGEMSFVAALGVDCRVEAIVGDFGCNDDELLGGPVASPGLRSSLGSDGAVLTNDGRIAVDDLASVDLLEKFNNGRVVVFPLEQAQERFTREGALDTILVVPEPGTDSHELRRSLEASIGEHNQVFPADWFDASEDPTVGLMMILGLMALVIGGLLAHNGIALNLEERRRDLAVSGALGASQRMLLAGTLIEAGLVGLAGGALGVLGGIAAARPLVDSMSEQFVRRAGIDASVAVPLGLLALGVALGCIVAVLAALRPAWRAGSADIAGELHARGTSTDQPDPRSGRRAVVLAGLATISVVVTWMATRDGGLEPWQPPLAQVAMVLSLAFTLLAVRRAAAPILGIVIGRLPQMRRGLPGIAADNLVGDPRRTGTMTLVVASAVYLGVMLGGVTQGMPAASAEWNSYESPGAVQVGSGLQNNTGSLAGRPSPEDRQRLERIPGVADVAGDYFVDVSHPVLGDQEGSVEARDGLPVQEAPVLRGDPAAEVLERGEVIIGTKIARIYNLAVGDTFRLPGRNGIETLRVGSIVALDSEMGESIRLPYERFEELFGQHAPVTLLATPEPGMRPSELADRIRQEFVDEPDLAVLDPDEIARVAAEDAKSFAEPFWALQRAMMLVVLVGALSTLLLSGLQRRRDYGVLVAVGLAPARLGRMVVFEALIVGVLGAVLGAVTGIIGLVVTQLVTGLVVGLPAPPLALDPLATALYSLLAIATVVAGALLPAWRASRLDPATALRYE